MTIPSPSLRLEPPRTTMWAWELAEEPGGLDGLISRAKAAGAGVVLKAADGRHYWGRQWNGPVVAAFRRAGVPIGLWTFNYGSGPADYGDGAPDYPGVERELRALETALGQAMPDFAILNIENQILSGQGPAREITALVDGARSLVPAGCGIGVSTVWHWAETLGWPMHAASAVDFWANQVYDPRWSSYGWYDAYLARYAAGKPDYTALWACGNPSSMPVDRDHVYERGARGVTWWVTQHMGPAHWAQAADHGDPIDEPGGGNPVTIDEAIDEVYDPAIHGAQLQAGHLDVPGFGDKVLFCERGLIVGYGGPHPVAEDKTSYYLQVTRDQLERFGAYKGY